MRRPDPYAPGQTIAAAMRGTQDSLKTNYVRPLPLPLRHNIDVDREGRLDGLADGLLPTAAECRQFERRVADLRQGSPSVAAFRQAMWLLMRVEGIDQLRRVELMRRALLWFRARGIAEGDLATPWAKSMVAIAEAQAGRFH